MWIGYLLWIEYELLKKYIYLIFVFEKKNWLKRLVYIIDRKMFPLKIKSGTLGL